MQNVLFAGTLITAPLLKSLSDCESNCRGLQACVVFAYDTNSGSCQMFSSFQNASYASGKISGHADCSKCLLTNKIKDYLRVFAYITLENYI
jgi:hypothetical protein